jgi:hypothetical protein
LVDAYHVPKLLSQQLLSFGRSGDGLEGLTFEVEQVSALSARRGQSASWWRTVRDVRVLREFFVFFACLCLRSVMALSFRWGRFQTVRSSGADSQRVPGGQSACSPRTVRYSGLSLEVLFAFSDSPRCRPGGSVVWVWIVRGSRPDGPRGPCGRSAPPSRTVRQSLSALFFGSISSSFRASACASRNRS